MPTVKRTIYYYLITSDTTPRLEDKLEAINRLSLEERATTHKGQQVLIATERQGDQVQGWVSILRQTGIPAVGKLFSATARELALDEDEGLSEVSHFVILPEHNLVAMEYNHYGPRAPMLFTAVDAIYANKIDSDAPPGEWAVMQGSQGYDAIQSARGIKGLDIAVARVQTRGADIADETLNLAFNTASLIGDTGKVELILKGDRQNRGILMSASDMLAKFLPDRNHSLDAYDKFQARIINETGGVEAIDLIKDRTRTFASVETSGRGRRIPSSSILEQMGIDIRRVARDAN